MSLKPLKQWICDKCGNVIESPNEGWLEWLTAPDTLIYSDFKIVHHSAASPYKSKNGDCYHYSNHIGRSDMHLSHFLGTDGMARMSTWTYSHGVKSLEEWAETFRRLHVPYYEEARRYWREAEREGYVFEGVDEESRYGQDILAAVIKEHKDKVDA